MSRRATIPPFVISAELEGSVVVVNLNSKRYYILNETAGLVWRGIKEGIDESEIVDRIFREYEATREHIGTSVGRMFDDLERAELITVQGD